MRPGDGEQERGKAGIREVKSCCDAGTQSGASNPLPSKAEIKKKKKWTELIYNNQNWKREF